MPEKALKPCPFCGGEKIRNGYIRDGRRIYCADCSASVTAFNPDATKAATSLWNCRAEREALFQAAIALVGSLVQTPEHTQAMRRLREIVESNI